MRAVVIERPNEVVFKEVQTPVLLLERVPG